MATLLSQQGDNSPRPFIAENSAEEESIRNLLRKIGTQEMGWTKEEVNALLCWPDSTIVGVQLQGSYVAGASIAHHQRPLPSELFDLGWCVKGERPVDASIVGIIKEVRRKVRACFPTALDALVKAIYWGCRRWDFTDILALMQPDRILIFNTVAGIALTVETEGQHRWCRRTNHDENCPLTYGIRINRPVAEEAWRINRPAFYKYVMTALT